MARSTKRHLEQAAEVYKVKRIPWMRREDHAHLLDGLPVVGIRGHLEKPARIDDEIRRQRLGRGRKIDRMVPTQRKGYPSDMRPTALGQ
jgi:hypothetical protein